MPSIKPILLSICLILLLAGQGPVRHARAADTCDLARDLAAEARKEFKAKPADGIRLFHKAMQLCDRDPRYKYNLGLAYYRYGNPLEAEKYLLAAVKQDGSRAGWLNDLASVMLENGSDKNKTLDYAAKAFKLAQQDDRLGPVVTETYARARFANGDSLAALQEINAGRQRWPAILDLAAAQKKIEADYVGAALALMRQGQHDDGLKLLREASVVSPLAARTFCLALGKSGREAEALEAAASFRQSQPTVCNEVWGELVTMHNNHLFAEFKAGKEIEAMMAAKTVHEKYPADVALKKAYDKLFEAFRNDRQGIEIAKATPRPKARRTAADVNIEESLDGIYGRTAAAGAADLKIAVDMDENIPHGRRSRPDGIAVVIGNCRYARAGKGICDVKYADRDALVMKKYLVKTMGFSEKNIIFYDNATGSDLRTIFGTPTDIKGRLYNYVRPGVSEVFVYYVGHGAPGQQGRAAYLVPVDASIDYIASSGYPVSQLYDNLKQLPAKSLMVVLDACFSGDSGGGKLFTNVSPSLLKNISPVRDLGDNSFILCGADKDQVCTWYPEKRHSLLTYYFLKGLQGNADQDGNRKITASEMENWLKREVPYWARRNTGREQTPLVKGNLEMVLAELK